MNLQERNNGQNNSHDVLQKAASKLATLDPKIVCMKSGVIFNREQDSYILPYLNRRYLVHHSTGKVKALSHHSKASEHLRILFLHYLACADGTPLSGEWIALKDLPGGQTCTEIYQKKNIHLFFQNFGSKNTSFQNIAASLEATPASIGKYSLLFHPLPRVPILFVSWDSDEKFSLSDSILYDSSVPHYLPIEDCALLPELIMQEITS